ncbi:MAG: hypothetical protein QMD71_09950 [bacterium]|nr:hypothetical protein [bacterium]
MQKKIANTNNLTWERILTEAGINNGGTIPVNVGRDDFMFGICGLYRKGVVEIYLCCIPNPKIPKEKLLPVNEEEFELAVNKTKEVLKRWLNT